MENETTPAHLAILDEIESLQDVITISRKARWMQLTRRARSFGPTLVKKVLTRKKPACPEYQPAQAALTYDKLNINAV